MATELSDEPRTGVDQRYTIALVGNPNTGKTTLFNGLTGLFQHVGNYPGVTVERKVGRLRLSDDRTVDLVDLPGTYSLAAHAPDEMIVADVLLGRMPSESGIDAVLAIVDASNLYRNLYLVSQVLELGIPAVVALNMSDVADARGIRIDVDRLSGCLGVPVVRVCANRRQGLGELRRELRRLLRGGQQKGLSLLPGFPDGFPAAVDAVAAVLESQYAGNASLRRAEALRAIVDEGGYAERRLIETRGDGLREKLADARGRYSRVSGLSALESEVRYDWIGRVLAQSVSQPEDLQKTHSDRIDGVLTHRIWGTLLFIAIMGVVFQAIYAWAGPLMDRVDDLFAALSGWVGGWFPDGALKSLIQDGIIAGVGGVVVFLPQIAILFFFIAVLEDCGYMARAALLMDRLLTKCGLSGQSFIPMLSSFACAVPGIMATRTIEGRRNRLVTILVAPLMSCSARLPVYTILIGAFIPAKSILGAWVGLQGLTLFAMYCVGVATAVPVAWLLRKTLLKGETSPFILEFPSYKIPDKRTVGLRVYQSSRAFLMRAGSIILAATIVMWALAYFPRPEETVAEYERHRLVAETSLSGEDLRVALAELDARMAAELLNGSFLGRAGHWIEPAVIPLGWDWRIGMATLASFPAREVIVATLGTIYSLGRDADVSPEDLRGALRSATWDDGRPVFNVPVALSVMVFFALCAQCVSTLAVIRRETQSWRWTILTFGYMTVLAYVAALVTYQGTMALGWGV
ncbi:MAG: ferrous iron transport protein B [Gemmatimonadota bacterium]|nr:ferrous iron transport protein B [Gemmatimonadota bacterium]